MRRSASSCRGCQSAAARVQAGSQASRAWMGPAGPLACATSHRCSSCARHQPSTSSAWRSEPVLRRPRVSSAGPLGAVVDRALFERRAQLVVEADARIEQLCTQASDHHRKQRISVVTIGVDAADRDVLPALRCPARPAMWSVRLPSSRPARTPSLLARRRHQRRSLRRARWRRHPPPPLPWRRAIRLESRPRRLFRSQRKSPPRAQPTPPRSRRSSIRPASLL